MIVISLAKSKISALGPSLGLELKLEVLLKKKKTKPTLITASSEMKVETEGMSTILHVRARNE